MKLVDREWKEFLIDNLFFIYTGGDLILSKIKNGQIPVISHTSSNNGIGAWSEIIPKRKLFSHKTTISLADRGNFCAFVQKVDFYIGTRVKALEFKETVSKFAMLFVAEQINKQSVKFNYGSNACDNLNILKIMLPVQKDYETIPDWDFMDKYIKEKVLNKKNYAVFYIQNRLRFIEFQNIEKLENKVWKEFNIIDLFPEIQRGKRLTKSKQVKGKIPYISSTAMNNGVDNYISNEENVRIFSDCLTIANSGSVGASFYQPFKFVASDHVTHLKNKNMNEFVYLFITTLTNRLKEKYNFNREINDTRISKEKILLPIDEKENLDYKYMEQYIKNTMVAKYNKYITK